MTLSHDNISCKIHKRGLGIFCNAAALQAVDGLCRYRISGGTEQIRYCQELIVINSYIIL